MVVVEWLKIFAKQAVDNMLSMQCVCVCVRVCVEREREKLYVLSIKWGRGAFFQKYV